MSHDFLLEDCIVSDEDIKFFNELNWQSSVVVDIVGEGVKGEDSR